MHSPLPDSSALERGILEDTNPSRLSRVQDNVRNLLRNSRFSSASPPTTPTRHAFAAGLPTPPHSPAESETWRIPPQPEVLPSPSTESTTSSNSSASASSSAAAEAATHQVPAAHLAGSDYARAVQQLAHQSTLSNARAVVALNHPDLSDPSLATFAQQKTESRHQREWKRSRRGSRRKNVADVGSSQCLLCVLAALLLSAMVATYVVLATTYTDVTPTFHILFVLGILLATIVFVHSVVRLFVQPRYSARKVVFVPATRRRHHQRTRHHRPPRIMPPQPDHPDAFVPATPIRVHMPADDEVRPDSREAEPTATADLGLAQHEWDKDVEALPNPPPVYGQWRGSVRANPDLLHWQVLPSPVAPDTPELPSPTYEEAMAAQRTGPPSYVTRDSPERRTERREANSEAAEVQAQAVEPEMVEGAGIGLGV